MAEATLSARRWNSFVCPGCRLVFRVPQDHDGLGIVCPSCRIMLRLPVAGEEPELLTPVEPEEFLEGGEEPAAMEEETAPFPWKLVLGMAVPGIALLIGFALWLKSTRTGRAPAVNPPAQMVVRTHEEEPPVDAELAKQLPNTSVLLPQLESVAKAFMEAPGMEEALKYVAEPERTRQRWTAWLDGAPYEAPGFRGVDANQVAVAGSNLVALTVSTADYEARGMAFLTDSNPPKIDWESWAGWSEMTWQDFRRQRPTQGKWFRVLLSGSNYFNFAFTDEQQWSSYQLTSPDGRQVIYGYAPRTSILDNELRPEQPGERTSLLLLLRFPENAPNDNQVIIEKVRGQGWIDTPEAH